MTGKQVLSVAAVQINSALSSQVCSNADGKRGTSRTIVVNPYKGVDWNKCREYKAALHVHTLQSDGWRSVPFVTG